ncbi:activator of spomin::LUC2 [Artemisia annua]|uniref:Activator of spomin::LUC2 n=1 Tax=Artemisia annua TaxID=35608 RepID=A0A2U1LDN0_ARTAN|nr:activator of spomin::LUC2 [Artemisia annua]
MAFISKVHNLSSDFQTPTTTLPMWYDETTSPSVFDNYGITMPLEYDITSWKSSLIPERFGVSEMVVPTSPAGFSSIPVGNDYQKVENDEYFCSKGGYGANSWSSYQTTTNNWETENQKTSKEIEEPTLKIGRYSVEERKDKIMRYLKKRNQRNFNKTIKYECRKTLADKRIRVRGRFAKNNNDNHHHHHDHHDHQPCEDQVLPNFNIADNPFEEDIQQLYTNNFLMKQDYDEEEEWLQEAMASLLYSPQIN